MAHGVTPWLESVSIFQFDPDSQVNLSLGFEYSQEIVCGEAFQPKEGDVVNNQVTVEGGRGP